MRPVTTAVVLLAAASVTTCTPLSSSGASVSNHDRMRLWMARRSEVASRIIAAWVANEHDPGAAAVVPVLEDDKRRRGRRREPLMVSEAAGGAVEYADGGNRARDVSPSAEAASGQIIHVPLHNWLTSTDLQWYCNITVGTPPQLLTILLDTGSVDVILPSSTCTTCHTRHKFSARSSSTYVTTNRVISQGFSTGAGNLPLSAGQPGVVVEPSNNPGEPGIAVAYVQGTVSGDAMRLGSDAFFDPEAAAAANSGQPGQLSDIAAQDMPGVRRQPFVLATAYPEVFGPVPFDGIMGLGLPGITGMPGGNQGFFWNLYLTGVLASPTFALHLQSGRLEGGMLTLGGVNRERFVGNISWANIAPGQDTWTLALGFIVDGSIARVASSGPAGGAGPPGQPPQQPGQPTSRTYRYPVLLDTGTPFHMTPSENVAAMIYGKISSAIRIIDPAGAWGAPCEEMERLDRTIAGRIVFMLDDGRVNITISPGGFNLGPYPGKPGICQGVFSHAVQQGWPWIIGGPLLKQYYTVWDGRVQRIGFAKLKNP